MPQSDVMSSAFHAPKAHITHEVHITCEANITFRAAEHIVQKKRVKVYQIIERTPENVPAKSSRKRYVDRSVAYSMHKGDVCAVGASDAVCFANSDVLRLCRKVM